MSENEVSMKKLSELLFEQAITWDENYENFVKALSKNADDPKTRMFLAAGKKDGSDLDDKFRFFKRSIKVSDLTPTQNEIDFKKSLKYPIDKPLDFAKYVKSNGPFTVADNIIVFNGKYIIDGHHRWSQLYACNKNAKIATIDVSHPGLDPIDMLKAMQAAIAISSGEVPVAVAKGINLLQTTKAEFASWMTENAGDNFYDSISADKDCLQIMKKTSSESKNVKQLVENYVWANVQQMQKTSQPIKGAPKRDFMPQTDNVDWITPLKQGQIDIEAPHAKKLETFLRIANIIK